MASPDAWGERHLSGLSVARPKVESPPMAAIIISASRHATRLNLQEDFW
jgi:hypothetical protein